MTEAGYPGVVFTLWVGLLAPTGTPAEIIDRLAAETAKGAQLADVRERLRSEGAEPFTTSPAQMAEIIRDETARWAQVVKAAKIPPQ
jgi:tripartite-type tricarboxylate transporter receptor subunit TctC